MNWIQLIWQFFPVVLQMIVAVEGALKGAPGAAKKAVILDALSVSAAAPLPPTHLASIGALVDTVVGSLNKTYPAWSQTPSADVQVAPDKVATT